jgi:hypothetical protein
MTETIKQITDAFETWEIEDAKFQKGNNSAGTRARKALQEISKLVKARRSEISEERKSRKESKS